MGGFSLSRARVRIAKLADLRLPTRAWTASALKGEYSYLSYAHKVDGFFEAWYARVQERRILSARDPLAPAAGSAPCAFNATFGLYCAGSRSERYRDVPPCWLPRPDMALRAPEEGGEMGALVARLSRAFVAIHELEA